MTGTLKKKSSFKDLEKWFTENMDILPETLDGGCKYYFKLKDTISLYIQQVYIEIDRHGLEYVKSKKSALANASKRNLYSIYEDLQIRENWNIKKRDVFDRFIDQTKNNSDGTM